MLTKLIGCTYFVDSEKISTFAESRGIRVRDDNPFLWKWFQRFRSPKFNSHSSEWLYCYRAVIQYWTLSPVDVCSPTVILILSSCMIYIFRNGFWFFVLFFGGTSATFLDFVKSSDSLINDSLFYTRIYTQIWGNFNKRHYIVVYCNYQKNNWIVYGTTFLYTFVLIRPSPPTEKAQPFGLLCF